MNSLIKNNYYIMVNNLKADVERMLSEDNTLAIDENDLLNVLKNDDVFFFKGIVDINNIKIDIDKVDGIKAIVLFVEGSEGISLATVDNIIMAIKEKLDFDLGSIILAFNVNQELKSDEAFVFALASK